MKRTRLVVLSDNCTNNKLLQTEHDLSVYMKCPSGKYLLDTGASDLFIRNAKVLGIDLADVDYCLISHGYNDHIGGFHLLDAHLDQTYETNEQLNSIAVRLHKDYPHVHFYTGHCTGDHCFDMISQSNITHIHQFHCGEEILLTSNE